MIARELKQRLIPVVDVVDIRVYGSRARGTAQEDADLDVFIEPEAVNKPIKYGIANIAWEVGLQHLIHISPLVFGRDEIEKTPQRSSPLVRTIKREGITVWAIATPFFLVAGTRQFPHFLRRKKCWPAYLPYVP